MGLDVTVPREGECPIAPLLRALEESGIDATVVMVDAALQMPNAPVPDGWRDLRLKTSAGTVTLKRSSQAIAVVVFGNADDALLAVQRRIAEALRQG